LKGIDSNNVSFKVTNNEVEGRKGFGKFEPREITSDLQRTLFGVYASSILLSENATMKLASWAESCPCHEPLVAKLSKHNREKLFQSHYGQGFKSCPNNGCHLLDVLSGELHRRVDALWDKQEAKLFTANVFEGTPPLTPAEMDVVLRDFHKI
jgi:hypothetical protein